MGRVLGTPCARPDVSVLIADDDAAIRRIMTLVVELGGMQLVGQAANGLEAVRLCEQRRPDIIVLDISMPLLDGFGAARQIAQLFPATKIIFVSSHTANSYVREALRIGGAGFLGKNYLVNHLSKAIDAALEGKTYLHVGGAEAAA